MPKERSLHRVRARTGKRVVCPACHEEYSSMGIHSHRGSNACIENQETRPIRLKVGQKIRNLEKRGKAPVSKVFINACMRRHLMDFISAEKHKTKYLEPFNGQSCKVLEEWWVDCWVASLYERVTKYPRSTNPTYGMLLTLQKTPPEDREALLGLYLLRHVEL